MTGLFAAKQDLGIRKMITRMLSAAKFGAQTFKELRDDPSATLQSFLIPPIVGLCYGIGLNASIFQDISLSGTEAVLVVILAIVSACVIGFAWSATSYAVVTRIFRKNIRYPDLARPFFFSWTPGILLVLLAFPNAFVSEAFRVIATVWVALASIFAVRHSSELTTQQSMITFIVSVLILLFALILFDTFLPLLPA